MKFFIFFIILFAISCSVPEKKNDKPDSITPLPISKFLPEEKIIHLFNSYENKQMGIFDERINSDGALRLDTLISPDQFFDKQLLKKMKIIQKSSIFKINGSADLRERDTPVISQWDGTCTAHGLSAAIENMLGGKINLSERHVWSRYKKYSCDAAIKAWDKGQACITESSKWPNSNIKPYSGYLSEKNCFSFLMKTKYIGNDLVEMMANLDKGKAVYIGMTVTKSMLNCDKVLNPGSAIVNGGHALSVVGYKQSDKVKGGGYFIIKNSWGVNCGDKGYQYIPFNYCNSRNDIYCIMWNIEQVK